MESIIAIIIKYKYAVLFPFAAFEGPIFALVLGFLIHGGYLSFLPVYGILIMGDLIPDSIYYYIGLLSHKKKNIEKYMLKLKIVSGNIHIIEKLWKDHPRKTMFLSKLAYGLSIPFLVSAGVVKMPFKKFVTLTLPVTFFQYALFLTLGYYAGKSYVIIAQYIKNAGLLVSLLLVLFVTGYIFIQKYAKKKIIEEAREEKL